MPGPDNSECNKAGEDFQLENQVGCCSTLDTIDKGNSGSVKAESFGTELVKEDRGGIVGRVQSDRVEDSSMSNSVKADLDSVETKYNVHQGEITSSDKAQEGFGVGIIDVRNSGKLESLSSSIQEGLEKVSLVGGKDELVIDGSDMKEMDSRIVTDDAESDTESESEASSSPSSSSSSSSSSSESDDDDEDEEMVKQGETCKIKRDANEQKVDAEEGEIMDSDAEKMVSWSDDDDDGGGDDDDDDDDENQDDSAVENLNDLDIDDDGDADLPKGGPIRSKNELEVLPPVPQVTVSLEPGHQISPVGVLMSVLGTQVIVEGSEKHNPLSEGSILWIAERRLPLGIIDEIFGPVKTPYYIVRYNSESEVPSDIQNGATIGFVPEFVDHVLNDKSLYKKGYDASGENDEEVLDEAEFSDDEEEAEYRKMLKTAKRGDNNESQGPVNKKKNRRSAKSREKTWTNNQSSPSQSPTVRPSPPNKMPQQMRPSSPCFSQGNQSGGSAQSFGQNTQLGPSHMGPVFPRGPNAGFTSGPSAQSYGQNSQPGSSPMGPVFPRGPNTFTQMPQQAPVLFNGNWANGMPSQHQNMAMSGGFQVNGMSWPQQNQSQPLQMPSNAHFPWQQQQLVSQFPLGMPGPSQPQFDLSQLVTGNHGSPLGPMNFNTGAPNSLWPGMLGPNFSCPAPFMPGVQNPNGQLPMFSGFMPNGPQPLPQSCNAVPATSFSGNEEVSSQTPENVSSGRGGGRKSFQRGRGRGRGRGRFGGGRGRQQ